MNDGFLRKLPLLWCSLAFLTGILLASWLFLPWIVWLVLASAVLVLAVINRILAPRFNFRPFQLLPSTQFLITYCLVAFFLGGFRYQVSIPDIDAQHVAWYNDRQYDVLVSGTLLEFPDQRDTYTNLRLRVEAIDTGSGDDLPVHGLLLARVESGQGYHYGDRLRLRARLETPPESEEFSYREYLAHQGIHSYMSYATVTRLPGTGGNTVLAGIYRLKEHSLETVNKIFPEPEASLLAGILLGVESGLPAELEQAFKDTGTAHIIAISGFNIAILSGLFVSLFSRWLGPRRGVVLAVIGILFYTLLVGADASVVRAAIMGILSLSARQAGRRQDGLNTLVFTAAFMALITPHVPWDVGFQLSFFATLGLVLYAPPFQQAVEKFLVQRLPLETARKVTVPVAEYFLFTLAAQLTTLPIMAYHFRSISLTALITNPVVLPAQPPVMVLGGIALLLGLVYLPLGQTAAYLAWPFSAFTIRVVEMFARIPGGVLALGEFSLMLVVMYYVVLLGITFTGSRLKGLLLKARGKGWIPAAAVFSVLAVLTLLVWRAAVAVPDGRLQITFLDAGSSDAVLITTPTGRSVLINGGTNSSSLSDGLGRRLSPFHRELDYLIIASTQENQVEALPRAVERVLLSNVLWAGNVEASYSSRQLMKSLSEDGIPVIQAAMGYTLDLGDGATLRVVNVNSRGAVLLVEWKGFRLLLPIGMNFDALQELAYGEQIGTVTALLLAESGYAPVNPPEWIENLNPSIVILSVAAADASGLPDTETLEAVEGHTLLRTDLNGWINLTTDGDQFWLEVETR